MKYLLAAATIAALAQPLAASAQADKVPAAAKKAFAATYPKAQKVEWDVENDGYEASFVLGNREMSAEYDKAGKLVATETEIAASELPTAVQTALAAQHKGHKVNEAAKIVSADGSVAYEAEIGGKDYLFAADGSPL